MQAAAAASPILSLSPSSPSFNSYSSANLAEIAARVVEEFRLESDSDLYDWEGDSFRSQRHNVIEEEEEGDGDEEEEGEFEFAFVCRKPDSPISADEIFCNGQIKPVYPVFDTSLLLNDAPTTTTKNHKKPNDVDDDDDNNNNTKSGSTRTRRLPLRKLMSEDRDTTTTSSCSSSEADELDGLQPGTYCVWTPPKGSGSRSGAESDACKKSSSTGSSKRWKFRDLLYRSNSDGKDTFVFLAPNKKEKPKVAAAEEEEQQYVMKKNTDTATAAAVKEVEDNKKKKTYLPYRQDLVGFFNNVNGLSRNLQPF